MRNIFKGLAAAALAGLAGCASVQQAGVASYSVKPMRLDGETVCCEIEVANGKEYAALDLKFKRTEAGFEFELRERGVAAFAGQALAHEALRELAATLPLAPAAIGKGTISLSLSLPELTK